MCNQLRSVKTVLSDSHYYLLSLKIIQVVTISVTAQDTVINVQKVMRDTSSVIYVQRRAFSLRELNF